jgi:hypothetical protein
MKCLLQRGLCEGRLAPPATTLEAYAPRRRIHRGMTVRPWALSAQIVDEPLSGFDRRAGLAARPVLIATAQVEDLAEGRRR